MHGDQPDDEFGNARELSHLRIALDSSSLFTQLICATTPGVLVINVLTNEFGSALPCKFLLPVIGVNIPSFSPNIFKVR